MAREHALDLEVITARLMRYRHVDPGSGCWVWTGKLNNGGYGQLTARVFDKTYPVNFLVHRLSFALFTGKRLLDGCHVDHKCRNPACFNPAHLRQVKSALNLSRRRYPRGTYSPRCMKAHPVSVTCATPE